MKLVVEENEFIYCDMQDVLRYLRQRDPATALRFIQAFKGYGGSTCRNAWPGPSTRRPGYAGGPVVACGQLSPLPALLRNPACARASANS